MDKMSLRDLEDDGHVLDHLASFVMIWWNTLERYRKANDKYMMDSCDMALHDVRKEMQCCIKDLADRKKRLRDEEQSSALKWTEHDAREREVAFSRRCNRGSAHRSRTR